MSNHRTVAVLGTGTMGAGMARQLQQHGHEVRAWNRSAERARLLAQDGITVCEDLLEAVRGAAVVLTMLYDAESVVEVLETAADGFDEDTVVLQAATVGLDIERVAAVAERLGVRLLDAPVLGTRKPAEDGTLVILASGDPALREVVDPVLDAVGSRTMWVADDVGPASRLKLVCNAWVGSITAAIGQSVVLAERLGLDPSLFLEAIEGTAVATPYAQLKGTWMTSQDTSVSFTVDGVRKDLGLITEAAIGHGVDPRVLDAVRAMYDAASEAGHGGSDMAAVHDAF